MIGFDWMFGHSLTNNFNRDDFVRYHFLIALNPDSL
jgi:hypothetical protein